MSDNQFPTDEPFEDESSQETSLEETNPSQDSGPRLPEEVKIGDQVYRREEVEEVFREFGGDWRKMQAAHTNRSKAIAAERRELEQMKEKLAAKEAELSQARSKTGYEDDETDVVQQLIRGQKEIAEKLALQEQRYQSTMQEIETQEKWDKAFDRLKTAPLAKRDEIKSFLDARGLGPEHVDLAYTQLYGQRVWEAVGEARAAERFRAPVLGSTGAGGISTEFTSAREASGRKPIGQTSWEDLERMSVEDTGVG